jgi:hypothetical protein
MKEVDKMESLVNITVQEVIPHLKDRVGELETRVARIEELLQQPPQRQRVPRNYQDYLKVKELIGRGSSINGAAKRLKLPYTTVHYYATATPDTVERLKNTPNMLDMDDDKLDKTDGES